MFDTGLVAAAVAGIDPVTVSDADRVDALIAVAHATAMLAALEQRLLAPLAVQVLVSAVAGEPLDRELDKHWIREELACALNWSGAAVEGRLHVAQTLVEQSVAEIGMGLGHVWFEFDGLPVFGDRIVELSLVPQ